MPTYVKAPVTDLPRPVEPGVVLDWGEAVIFSCLCGAREVYVTSPPHTIEFDSQSLLTITGSCGYRGKPNLTPPRPKNWCHFFMKKGKIEMCDDSKCPGGDGSIP